MRPADQRSSAPHGSAITEYLIALLLLGLITFVSIRSNLIPALFRLLINAVWLVSVPL